MPVPVTVICCPAARCGRSRNYVRAQTIAAANELLLKVQARIALVEALGDRHIATATGWPSRVLTVAAAPG